MPWNGSGTFSRQYGSSGWTNDKNAGTKIVASRHDTNDDDLATGINNTIAKDGQNAAAADLPMGGFKHTGVADATALNNYASLKQVQNSTVQYLTGVAGTDTITAGASIAPAAYVAGQVFRFISAGVNATTTPNLNVNGLGAKTIVKFGAKALAAGDIPSGALIEVAYDGTNFQLVGVSDINSALQYLTGVAGTDTITASALYTPGAYVTGQTFRFIPANTNATTTPTLNVSGLGGKTIVKGGSSALFPGDLTAGAMATVVYDGTNFQLMNPAGKITQSGTTSLSGTAVNLNNIPAWAKRVTLFFNAVTLSSTANLRVQAGIAANTPTASGYTGGDKRINSSAAAGWLASSGSGAEMFSNGVGRINTGRVVFENISGNVWVIRSQLYNNAPFESDSTTFVTLAGALSMVCVTSTSTDTLSGTVSFFYE